MLLAEEDVVLQGIIDRLIEAARQCGMEINVEKPSQRGPQMNRPRYKVVICKKNWRLWNALTVWVARYLVIQLRNDVANGPFRKNINLFTT